MMARKTKPQADDAESNALDINALAEGAQFGPGEASTVTETAFAADDNEGNNEDTGDDDPDQEGDERRVKEPNAAVREQGDFVAPGYIRVVVTGSTFHVGHKKHAPGQLLTLKQATAEKYIKLGWLKTLEAVKKELDSRNKSGSVNITSG